MKFYIITIPETHPTLSCFVFNRKANNSDKCNGTCVHSYGIDPFFKYNTFVINNTHEKCKKILEKSL